MKLQTPFFYKHLEYRARWMEAPGFAWELPACYSTVERESRMVREKAGFIDYGHQYTLSIAGKDSLRLLQKVLVNDLGKISPGKAIYSTIVNDAGTIIDDVICFWLDEDMFLLSGIRKQQVSAWLKAHSEAMDVYLVDAGHAMLAVQGPKAREILRKAVDLDGLAYFSHMQADLNGMPALIGRVGFTGELGYEIYVRPEHAHHLWETILELGSEHAIAPYGLDTGAILALEKGYLRLGDFYEGSTPLEVGLGWTVAFGKGDFIGRDALLKRKSDGLQTKLVGFEVDDSQVVAAVTDKLLHEGKVVGRVTRSGYGYTVVKSIGLAWVDARYSAEGGSLDLEHENKRTGVKLVRRQWYDPANVRVKS